MDRSSVDAIREELALLRASLLDDELTLTGDDLGAWTSTETPAPASSPPSLRIKLSSHDALLITYSPRPLCSLVSLSATSAAPSTELVKLLAERLPQIIDEETPYPVFELYNILHERAQELPAPSLPGLEAPIPSQADAVPSKRSAQKLVMLWSHHLLATSKRKDILAWSTELSLLGCSRIGYPGMIVALGGEDEVDEFVKRLKRLQWYALQVRHDAVIQDAEAKRAKEAWKSEGWREAESVGAMSAIMEEAGLKELFLEAMKIGH